MSSLAFPIGETKYVRRVCVSRRAEKVLVYSVPCRHFKDRDRRGGIGWWRISRPIKKNLEWEIGIRKCMSAGSSLIKSPILVSRFPTYAHPPLLPFAPHRHVCASFGLSFSLGHSNPRILIALQRVQVPNISKFWYVRSRYRRCGFY